LSTLSPHEASTFTLLTRDDAMPRAKRVKPNPLPMRRGWEGPLAWPPDRGLTTRLWPTLLCAAAVVAVACTMAVLGLGSGMARACPPLVQQHASQRGPAQCTGEWSWPDGR
jgi:hypothetical protein